MKFAILAITITSTILLAACTKTEFQFGGDLPSDTSAMHTDIGTVFENNKLNVLAPISANTVEQPAESVEAIKDQPSKKAKAKALSSNKTTEEQVIANTTPALTPPPAATEATSTISNWQPNEALVIRSTELIGGLQRELGRKPSVQDMQKRLQSHMGLSAAQAQKLIAVLGLG